MITGANKRGTGKAGTALLFASEHRQSGLPDRER
jgi:hypothetical protein